AALRAVTLDDHPCVKYIHDVTLRTGGKVLMTAGGKPVLVAWERGKGRVAAFLGTPMGEVGAGRLGIWESASWPKAMAAILRYLARETP
ncbi:MAG TPA: hypothetical protein VGM23_18225, partial [Armatimonadota bacterium]